MYFHHIHQGHCIVLQISLRYEAIDDPAMDIYVTLSGFIFYKVMIQLNSKPKNANLLCLAQIFKLGIVQLEEV